MGLVSICNRCGGETRPHDHLEAQPCRKCLEAENRELHDDLSFWESLVDDDDADWPHRDPRFRRRVEEKLVEAERLRGLLDRWVVDADAGRLDGVDMELMVESERLAVKAGGKRLRPPSVRESAARLGIKTSDHQDDLDIETGKGGSEHE